MDDATVDTLLVTETERIEWKESGSKTDEFLESVCALANDLGGSNAPGYVVIGVNKQGLLKGVDDRGQAVDELQQKLTNQIHSIKVQPVPSCDLSTCRREGKTLLVVCVNPYPVPPVVTVNSVAWVRVGTTTRRAKDADLIRLKERRPEGSRPFDTRLHPEATLDDLDRGQLKMQYEAESEADQEPVDFPEYTDWLTNRRELGATVNGIWRPCQGAVLLYGVHPQRYFPGAAVELVRFAGEDIDSPVTWRRSIEGTLPRQLDVAWAQIDDHLVSVPAPEQGVQQAYLPIYPPKALKELVRNLVQHRLYEGTHAPGRIEWFSDRIEFSNPGGPFGRAGEGVLGEQSDYRNPLVTKELVHLGYVEQLGRGLKIVRQQLAKNGNPPLEVETDGFTRLIVRARRS